jgi:hypothetical protein
MGHGGPESGGVRVNVVLTRAGIQSGTELAMLNAATMLPMIHSWGKAWSDASLRLPLIGPCASINWGRGLRSRGGLLSAAEAGAIPVTLLAVCHCLPPCFYEIAYLRESKVSG